MWQLEKIRKEYEFWLDMKNRYLQGIRHAVKDLVHYNLKSVSEFMNQEIENEKLLAWINAVFYHYFFIKEKVEKITILDLLRVGEILKKYNACYRCIGIKDCPYHYVISYPRVKDGRILRDDFVCQRLMEELKERRQLL